MRRNDTAREKKSAQSNGDDTQISRAILRQATDAVLRRVKVNRSYDVPYLAGYSEDGRTIYIDRDVPKTFTEGRRRLNVEPFIILHESVEKALVDQLGLVYQHAHQIALRAEKAAVLGAKIRWDKYDTFIQKYVKTAEERPDLRIPPDLDLEPYKDEDDAPLLRRMQREARGNRGKSRPGRTRRRHK